MLTSGYAEGRAKIRNSVQRPRHSIIQAICVAILAPGLPLAGADSLPVNRPEKAPTGKQWRVKYMGGPELLKRGTRVDLAVTDRVIRYSPTHSRPGHEFSIQVAAVTDVSDAVIEGNRAEEVFGPDEPDYVSPCGSVRDPGAFQLCLIGSAALETPFAIIASVLSNIPFKDHFVRVAWQREEKAAVVFKVSGREYAGLLEELQMVTGLSTESNLYEGPANERDTLASTNLPHADRVAPLPQIAPPQGKRWHVKLVNGLHWNDDGSKAKVIISREEVFCETRKGKLAEAFSIPVVDVTEISYFTLIPPPGDPSWPAFDYCQGPLCVPLDALKEAAGNPEIRTRHFVLITWKHAGKEKDALLRLGRGDYPPFLAELQRVTGILWKDMTQGELDQAKANAIPIQLDRNARLDETDACCQEQQVNKFSSSSIAAPAGPKLSSRITHTGLSLLGTVRYGRCLLLASDTPEYRENCTRDALNRMPPMQGELGTGGRL